MASTPKSNTPLATASTPAEASLPVQRRADWRSFALSSAFHIVIVVALVLLGLKSKVGSGSPEIRRVDVVLQSVNEQNETEYLSEDEMTEASNEAADASLDSSPPVETLEQLEPLDQSAMPAFELPTFNAPGMTQLPSNASSKGKAVELTDAQQEMLASDRARFAAEDAKGSEISINVFGSGELTGRKFVFVIDRSKSMGSQGLGVLDIAGSHLTEALAVLKTNHRFQVIAYHRRTTTIGERKLLRANEENKQKIEEFVGKLAAFGSTQHESALIVALSLRPDIVVLMTDGGRPFLNRGQLENIRRTAGSAQIHCIEFGSGPRQNSGGFMEALAAENEGSYRYVDVNQWQKNN